MASQSPKPARVLIAEDEFLVGVLLEEGLQGGGYETVGPFTDLEALLEAIGRERYDAAVLDVNLGGEMVFPAALELKKRKVPLVVLTGYGVSSLPAELHDMKIMAKPYDFGQLDHVLRDMLGARSAA